MSKFEYVNFKINKKYFKFFYDNPKYYIYFKISKFKYVVSKSVHWFRWLFDCYFTHIFRYVMGAQRRKKKCIQAPNIKNYHQLDHESAIWVLQISSRIFYKRLQICKSEYFMIWV
jgi:hypothetical protein